MLGSSDGVALAAPFLRFRITTTTTPMISANSTIAPTTIPAIAPPDKPFEPPNVPEAVAARGVPDAVGLDMGVEDDVGVIVEDVDVLSTELKGTNIASFTFPALVLMKNVQ